MSTRSVYLFFLPLVFTLTVGGIATLPQRAFIQEAATATPTKTAPPSSTATPAPTQTPYVIVQSPTPQPAATAQLTSTPQPGERPDRCEANDARENACNLPIDNVSGPFSYYPVGDQDWYRVDLGAPSGLETIITADATYNIEVRRTLPPPPVTQRALPALFQGAYREESDLLAPVEAGQPYLTVLTAYDVRGEWDLHSLMPLLMGDHELVLVVDVQTLPRARALRKATDAHNVLREAIYGKHALKDARAERAYGATNLTLSRLDMENLHEVSYALLLSSPSAVASSSGSKAPPGASIPGIHSGPALAASHGRRRTWSSRRSSESGS